MKHIQNDTPPLFIRLLRSLARPQCIVLIITFLLVVKIIAMGQLVYGDIPYFDIARSKVNFLYAWGPEQLGTSVRQGLNTLRDQVLVSVSPTNGVFYFLKYVLPIMGIPFTYLLIFKRLGITNRVALVIASVLPLFTPIVFGDFITGQTFWIYLTVPWVFYIAIRIFCLHDFALRNYVLLALLMFISLGMLPPIIVPLIVTLAIFVGFAFLFTRPPNGRWVQLRQYIIAGGVTCSVFALLAAPYLFVASSGQAAYTPASLLGDYYHNYSGTYYLNIFRLAGNNGNGQSTLGYNSFSLPNVAGYIVFILVVAGAMVAGISQRRQHHYQSAIICLLATLLIILGFLNFMATNMDVGALVFQSQWVVSTIRNPSKIYTLILPMFTFLVAFCIQNGTTYIRAGWHRNIAYAAVAAMVVAYGWPALHGDLGLLYGREDKISSYKQDPVVRDIADAAPATSRSLLIPANHRDELNYQNLNPGLNILRLEGGMPQTTALVKRINTAFNNRDRYFFTYLATAGIHDVFVKKDPHTYEQTLFTLFPVTITPAQAKAFLSSHMQMSQETHSYWRFTLPEANQLVFSPSRITRLDGDDSLQTETPFMGQNQAVVGKNPAAFTPLLYTYATQRSVDDGATIASGLAQLHDPSLLLADIYSVRQAGGQTVIINIIDPLTQAVQRTYRQPVSADTHMVFLNDQGYTFSAQKRRITLRADDYRIEAATLEPVQSPGADLSFESSALPTVHDATPHQAGKPGIAATISKEARDGKQSLLLSSTNHTAFIEKDFSVQNGSPGYLLVYDHKNLSGQPMSVNLVQYGSIMPIENNQVDANAPADWHTNELYITPESEEQNASVQAFFYTSGTATQPGKNLLDNVRIFRVHRTYSGNLSLANYAPDYPLQQYVYHAPATHTDDNLLDNSSFEEPSLWGKASDATATASGKANVQASQSLDAHSGNAALQLESSNHTAYVAKAVRHFQANTVYKLSMYYKHVSGHNPTFAVWQNGAEIARPSQELKPQHDGWNYFETYFVPDKTTTNLTLYLYSPSNGEHTTNLYDDISLTPTSLIATYFRQTNTPTAHPDAIVAGYRRINPTAVAIDARPGKGMVVFNESFHAGWQAYALRTPHGTLNGTDALLAARRGQLIRDHTPVTGFANGWWVNSAAYGISGDYTILLVYTPQKTMAIGMVSMTGTSIAALGYIGYDYRKQALHRGWRWQ